MLVAELTHLMEVNFAYGIAPPCRNPFTERAAHSTVSNARDAGVQTNRELCDTKRIITRRRDRSYGTLSLPPLPLPLFSLFLPRAAPFPLLPVASSPHLLPPFPLSHACNNVKLFAPLYAVNFRKCALSLPRSSSRPSSISISAPPLHDESSFGISLCEHRAADTRFSRRGDVACLTSEHAANRSVAFYAQSAR